MSAFRFRNDLFSNGQDARISLLKYKEPLVKARFPRYEVQCCVGLAIDTHGMWRIQRLGEGGREKERTRQLVDH